MSAPAEHAELALFDAIASALGQTDFAASLESVLGVVGDAIGYETGWMWLREPSSDSFYLAAARNLPPFLQEPVRMTGELCWCMESFLDGDFASENVDVIACSRLRTAREQGEEPLTEGLHSHATVALKFGDRDLGIMNLTGRHRRALNRYELRLLSTVGAQVGIAIERARLADETAALARSQERARLAREIHDTLAQDLTAIALNLENVLRRFDGVGETDARAGIERALDVARNALRDARGSLEGLRSDPLDGKPLGAALLALARRFTSRTGVLATCVADDAALARVVETELYRVAAEALTNVERHAKARRVEIELEVLPAEVRLSVQDDGVGYDPGSEAENRYGLIGMEERTRAVGGVLSVMACPEGSGTVVLARVPRGEP